MSALKPIMLAAAFALAAAAAHAGDIVIKAPYARVSTPMSKSGAAFFEIENKGAVADRLIGVQSDAAAVTQLHTHEAGAGGVMRMVEVKGGIAVPAHGTAMLARGGDHVMLMGLKAPLKQGDVIHLTLEFQKAGKVRVDVPVDNSRKGPMAKMKMTD